MLRITIPLAITGSSACLFVIDDGYIYIPTDTFRKENELPARLFQKAYGKLEANARCPETYGRRIQSDIQPSAIKFGAAGPLM